MPVERSRTVRLKLCDELYERLLTKAAQLGVEHEVLAGNVLERWLRRQAPQTRAA